jgi:hypothetical protein
MEMTMMIKRREGDEEKEEDYEKDEADVMRMTTKKADVVRMGEGETWAQTCVDSPLLP